MKKIRKNFLRLIALQEFFYHLSIPYESHKSVELINNYFYIGWF